ncbi:UPF0149 family protein [Oxalobacter vibrioformis]|uniref:UPF0149 family protein n=2 Tax=Oxalobacter vibrioformis TaxID=933080 RepID=A0A9E9LYP5_9BURK|nr:UPF0149 family protein [Oxalobacter vibrioformis]WAW11344.1 UPF0149 family protein [Oxalobacter vibrioformis]
MSNLSVTHPLSEEEFNRLSIFLTEIDPSAMNLEMLDGFFVALVCSPDLVLPSEYLPQILGESHAFDSMEEASDILGLIMRHWNAVVKDLARTLDEKSIYEPLLFEDETGFVSGNDWAAGFLHGVMLRPAGWHELISSEEKGGLVLPFMMLAHEHDPEPEMRSPEIPPEKREEVLEWMIGSVPHIYRYFEPHRRAGTRMPLRNKKAKTGRNELCPCGSGKKFKQCCSGQPTLH